jgi:UDPglucose 6-dehydrogenase
MHLFLVGAGHVGLVTAVGLARLGHRVTVADVDVDRIQGLTSGVSPVFEPGLEEAIRAGIAAGHLAFTTDVRPPAGVRFSIVTVSTPTGPDGPLSTANVEAATLAILDAVDWDHTIVIRSTLPIDGPDRLLAALGDRTSRPAIVTNPEFMAEGSAMANFERPDRIVAGWLEPRDRGAAAAVLSLYDGLTAPTLVADARSVALIKLASNVFLAAKVAYANELARICDASGANVDTVADGIGLDARIGRAFLNAGPGFGGSCFPEQAVGLAQVSAALGLPTPLIDSVSRSNDAHQRSIVDALGGLLGGRDAANGQSSMALRGRRIALLGLAFKANTDDVRESPALALARYLRAAGASVVATDPRAIAKARHADPALEAVPSVAEAVEGADAILVATEWREFAELDWIDLAARMAGDLVYDTRNIVVARDVSEAGLRLVTLGRPEPVRNEPVERQADLARSRTAPA